jgi:hypothetical protein
VTTNGPLYPDRIKSRVDQDLQAKGWQAVPSGGDMSTGMRPGWASGTGAPEETR